MNVRKSCQFTIWLSCLVKFGSLKALSFFLLYWGKKMLRLVNMSQQKQLYLPEWLTHWFSLLGWEHLQRWGSRGFDRPWSHSIAPLHAVCIYLQPHHKLPNCHISSFRQLLFPHPSLLVGQAVNHCKYKKKTIMCSPGPFWNTQSKELI